MASITSLISRRKTQSNHLLTRLYYSTLLNEDGEKKKKIEKILIANRGEIACRIIRTAKRLGIRTVAVYSDADKHSLHVKSADEAVRIGPPAARLSYLKAHTIIEAARRTGAQVLFYYFMCISIIFIEFVNSTLGLLFLFWIYLIISLSTISLIIFCLYIREGVINLITIILYVWYPFLKLTYFSWIMLVICFFIYQISGMNVLPPFSINNRVKWKEIYHA